MLQRHASLPVDVSSKTEIFAFPLPLLSAGGLVQDDKMREVASTSVTYVETAQG